MITPEERQVLIEAAATAWRPRGARGELRAHPAFSDLDAEGRERAFDVASELRRIEALVDPEGLSTTARAVLAQLARSTSGDDADE